MFATVNLPQSFVFTAPTQVTFGVGAAQSIAEQANSLGGTRALVVSDKGVIAAGIVEPIMDLLSTAGLSPLVFDDFSANPKDFECVKGLEAATSHGADILVAVGGGSSMDTAKVIGTLLANGGRPIDWAGIGLVENPLPPLIAVPTTSGTASEVSYFAVFTDTENRTKTNIVSPYLYPEVALLDPALTKTVPPAITAATGMDVFCHAFESYTCTAANPITEGLALYAMELVGRYLRRAVADGSDMEARANMQVASTIAGLAFSNSDCCGVHCLAESLGGLADLPHGVACAIFLPYVFEYNMPSDYSKHARTGEVLGLDVRGLSAGEAARKTLEYLIEFERSIGIPRLREIPGADPALFPLAAKNASLNVSAPSQPCPTGEKDYLEMFQRAWKA